MSSIMQRLALNQTSEQHSLGVLIKLIETEYPNEDTNDINNLRRLLHKEFNVEFSETDIINHTIIEMEEEDVRLQYKHLNIKA